MQSSKFSDIRLRSPVMFTLIKKEKNARRGQFVTPHGTIQTPVFMNVATAAAIKGGVDAFDLADLKCQVMLCNTYHLHLRPGDGTVRQAGGVRKFTGWQGPVLTDSGGFQVFSLSGLRKISEEGVTFASHLDGHRIFMGPEESMRIQSNLGSTIAMAFDECVENPAAYEYSKRSCERTYRWLARCKEEMTRLNSLPDTVNPKQMLFGINQGCTFEDLRVRHMKDIATFDLDGYAIGGLAVGEPTEEMYRIIEAVEPFMPVNKPRYLMGVGTPVNILEAVFIGLWSLLFLFPGVIAYYRYSQAIYILVDDPTKSPMQCIRESKAMMSGHKGELFALDLSFLGWYILSLIPMLGYGVRVWTVPYIGMTKALYFEALRGDSTAYASDTFNVDRYKKLGFRFGNRAF